jgi:hypothetical protein
VNYYFHQLCGRTPFGWNSDDLGSIYKGLVRDITKDFEHLRDTTHSHNALDDAMGNAEALVRMIAELGFSLPR